jgi:predicted nucleic acid-binding protein
VIVLDASTVLEILLQTESGAPVAERLLTSDASLHAPHLLDVEVAQVLRRFVAQGEVPEARARQALADLGLAPEPQRL